MCFTSCESTSIPRFCQTSRYPPNVLPLSRVRPYRTRLRDATRRAVRAAEAAGQTTAARRLLRRVSPPAVTREVGKLSFLTLLEGGEHMDQEPSPQPSATDMESRKPSTEA